MNAKAGLTVAKKTFQNFSNDDAPLMAAALAYYTVFSLPPLLLIIITLTGLLVSPDQVQMWIEGRVGELVGADAGAQIQTMVENAQERVEGGISAGLILSIGGLLFGATGAFAQLQRALNTAWDVEPDPESGGIMPFIMKRIFSLGMILVVAFLLLVSLVLSSVISAFANEITGFLPAGVSTVAIWIINGVINLLVITLLFAAIFKVLPDAKIQWRHVWVGAFVTALLFVAGMFGISFYIGQTEPGEAFGAAAALAVILIWVYIASMILLLGAEFTQTWARRRGDGILPDDNAVKVVREKRHVRDEEEPKEERKPQREGEW